MASGGSCLEIASIIKSSTFIPSSSAFLSVLPRVTLVDPKLNFRQVEARLLEDVILNSNADFHVLIAFSSVP